MSYAPSVQAASALDEAIDAGADALMRLQKPDGHWVFELEADATIPAEYIILRHYLGEPVDAKLESKIAAYLRRTQTAQGGWPLFHGGAIDISATVKSYFALKLIGDPIDEPHMTEAREAVLQRGGAAAANVFTRFTLALYGIIPWRAVPAMPVEIMLLPRWFPVHLSKVSYWARTVLVPLLVLQTLKPVARNPKGITLDELFLEPPGSTGPRARAPHQSRMWFHLFNTIDALLHRVDFLFPKTLRKRATEKATAFVTERLNGEDGLGAIFPAMANAVMMFDALGYPTQHPHRLVARASVEKLLVERETEAYCQPCLSPVWDTALASHALMETGRDDAFQSAQRGLEWLLPRQVLDVRGDWSEGREQLAPGGWAFQYANPHYPDLDDTAVIAMAMHRAGRALESPRFDTAIDRACSWIEGLQSKNGGWAAFDADNDKEYLNNVPFSDHGALLDPPTPDLTGRCVSMLAQCGRKGVPLARGIEYLKKTQRRDGAWFGRWGINYIYGTWSAVCALRSIGMPAGAPQMHRAAAWLTSIQNDDGGWGEDGDSYRLDYDGHRPAPSSPSQTAWALLALMAAGKGEEGPVARGVAWLIAAQQKDGLWREEEYTGTGFPRVFYLRYHGYPSLFSLWALARYRNVAQGNCATYGM